MTRRLLIALTGVLSAGALLATAFGSPPEPAITAPPLSSNPVPRRVLPLRPGDAVEVRVIVRRPGTGRVLANGAWRKARSSVELPSALRRGNHLGAVEVVVLGRSAQGIVRNGKPVLWSLMPDPAPPRVVHRIRTAHPWVAITVDDGNNEQSVKAMIATARTRRVKLTFCFSGRFVEQWSSSTTAALREAVRDGTVEVCSHGYSHRTNGATSEAEGVEDLARSRSWDVAAGIPTRPFFRPPYGAVSSGLMAALTRFTYPFVVLWDVETFDWRCDGDGACTGPREITRRAVTSSKPGSIILMHTMENATIALPRVITGLQRRGLQPVGLGELFSAGQPE